MVQNTNVRNDMKGLSDALSFACENGHMNLVKWIMDNTAYDINYANDDIIMVTLCCTLLCGRVQMTGHDYTRPVCKGDVSEVSRLVYECGDNINAQDNDGQTPLHWACLYGHRDIVETLMLAGADETITDDDRQTPAQLAESMDIRNCCRC